MRGGKGSSSGRRRLSSSTLFLAGTHRKVNGDEGRGEKGRKKKKRGGG